MQTNEASPELVEIRGILDAHFPAVVMDHYGHVLAPGYLASDGAYVGTVVVSHRGIFPSPANGRTFQEAAQEEINHVATYARLLGEANWKLHHTGVTNRPRLLAYKGATPQERGFAV